MPMPNRQMVGGELYRYAFQGQDKDPETGKEAFQLRLWDGRIGRWLTTDPAGQYSSPYLGMGNNPINGVDADGAFWEELGNWISGSGWNSNAALEFQASGGTLGEWYGNKFSGYRRGTYTPEGGGSGIATFSAKQDFWAGVLNPDKFGIQGRAVFGFTSTLGAEGILGIYGGGVGISQTSVIFLGGDYGHYWYNYGAIEGGPSIGAGVGGSGSLSGEYFIAFRPGDPSPNPSSFGGAFGSFSLSGEGTAVLGGTGFASITHSAFSWTVIGIGGGITFGGKISATAQIRLGTTLLITPDVRMTKDRNFGDMLSNHFLQNSTNNNLFYKK